MPIIDVLTVWGFSLLWSCPFLLLSMKGDRCPLWWADTIIFHYAAPIIVYSRKTGPILLELYAKNNFNSSTTNN